MSEARTGLTAWFLTEPSGDMRVYSLDILRGFMALAVAVLHFGMPQWTGLAPQGSRLSNITNVFGPYGVEGFFMVSGFCFFYLYGETRWTGQNLARFHIKRFFRIAPLYYAAILGTLWLKPPFGTVFFGPPPSARILAENASLTFGLIHPSHSLLIGGWSIGLEYVFYFALPFLVMIARRKVLLYGMLAAFLALAWPWNFIYVPSTPSAWDQNWHTYVQIPNHAFLFLLGGVAAHLRSLVRWRLTFPAFLGLTLLLLFLAIPKGPLVYDTFTFMMGRERAWYVTIFFLLVMVFALYDAPRHFLRAPFVLLGDLSYSVYLLHPFAYFLLLKTLPETLAPPIRFSAALLATFGLAYAVYRWLEKPAMALGKRLADRA